MTNCRSSFFDCYKAMQIRSKEYASSEILTHTSLILGNLFFYGSCFNRLQRSINMQLTNLVFTDHRMIMQNLQYKATEIN